MKDSTTIGLVTFGVFMTEALIHYNTGIADVTGKPFKFNIPPGGHLVKLALIVGAATTVSTSLITYLRK
tara:strand:- start:1138 stop:1344 length:207 start_codon:yes stop_codon:yes gene_type:complete